MPAYRHRVTIEEPVETQGSKGQAVRSWTALYERVPALVTELAGRELFNAQQIQADITHQIVLHFLPAITAKMRVVWHDGQTDRTLSLLSKPLNPDGRRRKLILQAKEPT